MSIPAKSGRGNSPLILIGLGANLEGPYGPPEDAVRTAMARLAVSGLRVVAGSSIWKTAPVPTSDQPWYRNAVCGVETSLPPLDVLKILKTIEQDMGRVSAERNAARVIDLDLLAYHDDVMEGNLTIPHPRMHERAFVLYPLYEIVPDWQHPVLNKSVNDLIAVLPKDQLFERIEGKKLCT